MHVTLQGGYVSHCRVTDWQSAKHIRVSWMISMSQSLEVRPLPKSNCASKSEGHKRIWGDLVKVRLQEILSRTPGPSPRMSWATSQSPLLITLLCSSLLARGDSALGRLLPSSVHTQRQLPSGCQWLLDVAVAQTSPPGSEP